MYRIIIHIVFLLLISTVSHGQSKNQYQSIGDKSMEKSDYRGAVNYYKLALDYDSLDLPLTFQYAEALRLTNNYKKAQFYYEKIYRIDGGREFPDAVFWLASMQKINGDYLESYKTWKHVLTIFRKGNSYENKKAKQEIKASAYARRSEKYRTDALVENIGYKVNTDASEFAPIVFKNTLYFSSLRAKDIGSNGEVYDELYQIKLYQAQQQNFVWETEKELPLIINSPEFHSGNGCFNSQGDQFYFSRCDNENVCDIMVSEYKSGKWGEAKKLGINESGTNTTQPMSCEINGEEYLFFASDRKGGIGKLDIWFAKRSGNGKFENPVHTGKNINSPDNEVTPFYDVVGKQLYFSSDWHSGLGGFDIFSSMGNPNCLSRPKNLGAPINSRFNDLYYFIDTVSDVNYFASNRILGKETENTTCCNDIYSVKFFKPIPPKEINIITLEDLNNYLPVTLYFHNDRPNPRTTKTTTEYNYLTTYDDYIQRISTYENEYSAGLSGIKEEEAILDIQDFFTDFVEKGVKDLTLFTELLFLELEKGTEIELTVKGFASPLAKTAYNLNLTSRRISSLVNYLQEIDNGKFNKYFDNTVKNGGRLTIKSVPFGEYTANKLVSDNLNDKKNSVYSRAAALERKIEIQSVSFLNKKDSLPRIQFDKESIDLGKWKNGIPIEVEFTISNSGDALLIVNEIKGSCSCTVIEMDEFSLKAGESKTIKALINTDQLSGKLTKTVTVKSNAVPKEKTFVITFEINEDN